MSKRDLKSVVPEDVLKDITKGLSANLVPTKKQLLDYPENLNPFQTALSKIRLKEYENLKLSEFLEKVVLAKNVDELNRIVEEALDFGIRVNARNEDGFSFSQVTVHKIYHSKFIGKKQENIIKKLALKGANFDEQSDKEIIEVCHKIQKEVEPQIYNRLQKLREVGENAAIEGSVENVEIDNKTFFVEFSQDSKVEIAKVVQGAKDLGLSKGEIKLSSSIIKIGDGEIEIKTGKNGERNYVDISDKSGFTVTFHTNFGELNVKVWHSPEQYNQIKVEVENKELWNELQKTGEIIGKDCLFGGMSVKAAIESGGFMRSGIWGGNSKYTEIIRHNKPQSSETISSLAGRTKGDKTSSIARS